MMIGFTFLCLGKKRPQNVTLLGNRTMKMQGTIIGAIQVPQITGAGDANVEGFPTEYPAYGACDFDALTWHHQRLS